MFLKWNFFDLIFDIDAHGKADDREVIPYGLSAVR